MSLFTIINRHRHQKFYLELFTRLTGPIAPPVTPLGKLSDHEMDIWWNKVADKYAPQQANQALMIVRRALKLAAKSGTLFCDPTMRIKRLKVPRTRLNLPSIDQFYRIVQSIRSMANTYSDEAADYVEFMTYSGMRPKEINAADWANVFERFIRVTDTKNGHERNVPVTPPMADLLRRMREREGIKQRGKIFRIKAPRDAVRNACKRLLIPHQKVYAFRHLFASECAAAGVPVSTFADWLGHQDGGALALRTYVHQHDEHSQLMAKRVTFRSPPEQ